MPRVFTGSNSDPEFRRERARKAGRTAQSSDTLIATLVRRAPELTEDNKATLRALLASVDGGR